MQPKDLIARRAGEVVSPTDDGKSLAHAGFTHDGSTVESWLPLEADNDYRTTETRMVYEPAGGTDETSTSQVALGALLYGLGVVVVLVAFRGASWAAREETPRH